MPIPSGPPPGRVRVVTVYPEGAAAFAPAGLAAGLGEGAAARARMEDRSKAGMPDDHTNRPTPATGGRLSVLLRFPGLGAQPAGQRGEADAPPVGGGVPVAF